MHLKKGLRLKLSRFSDYSLRRLMNLAAERGRRATIGEVAQAFGISEHHLRKLAYRLGRGGWLTNTRGRGGGLALALPPAKITIGAGVRDTELGDVPANCSRAGAQTRPISRGCPLREVLGAALEAFHGVLDRTTLADLAREPRLRAQRLHPAPRPGAVVSA